MGNDGIMGWEYVVIILYVWIKVLSNHPEMQASEKRKKIRSGPNPLMSDMEDEKKCSTKFYSKLSDVVLQSELGFLENQIDIVENLKSFAWIRLKIVYHPQN